MTICPNVPGGHGCICQPQDGVMCPYGITPPWKPFTEQTDVAVCSYCGKCSQNWSNDELKRGSRYSHGVQEYHCYEAYCMD